MKRIFCLGSIYLLLTATTLFATAFDDANRQYQSGNFSEAAATYEKILVSEGPRAAVFYNLGNSYQSLKQYGPAILAYERARLLAPRDRDLRTNLALARKASGSFEGIGNNPRLEAALVYLSRDEWSWLSAGAALIFGAVILLCGSVRLPRRMYSLAGVIAGAAGLLIVTGAAVLHLRRGESSKGIILFENATVRLSPFDKAESLGILGPGSVVRLGVKSGNFQYVEASGTNVQGWLADKEVAAVVPR